MHSSCAGKLQSTMYSWALFLSIIQAVLGLKMATDSSKSPRKPVCGALSLDPFPDFEVLSVSGVEVYNYSVFFSPTSTAAIVPLNFCNVTVILTHPGNNDYEIVRIWLPLDHWKGRFQATGGFGLAAGYLDPALGPPVALGFAAGSTDGGLTLNQTIDPQTGKWILNADNSVNWGLMENFAHRSIHDMTVIGKALATCFYGAAPNFSYYTGCSTGGRQGYFAAQLYANDFDGIMANAPELNSVENAAGLFWAPVVMENIAVPLQCIFTTYTLAIIKACDPLDGVVDGLISSIQACDFDTESLVGSSIPCSDTGGNVTITRAHAEVVSKVLQGARTPSGQFLWYGVAPGASFQGVANTSMVDGVTVPVPFVSVKAFLPYAIFQDPDYDTTQMTFADIEKAFGLSKKKFTQLLGNEHPNLTAFRNRGGKLLTWHGMADQLLNHLGTVLYRTRLEDAMGGADGVNDFYRLFLAPGAFHCQGGYGPVPTDPLTALVEWVENGVAPTSLSASGMDMTWHSVTRDLCPYPKMPVYDGVGDVKAVSSFSCT